MNDEAHREYVQRAQQFVAAQRLREDVQRLEARWHKYSFPIQELLKLLLRKHGLDAAALATDALDEQSATGVIFTSPCTVSKRGVLHHERCIKPNVV